MGQIIGRCEVPGKINRRSWAQVTETVCRFDLAGNWSSLATLLMAASQFSPGMTTGWQDEKLDYAGYDEFPYEDNAGFRGRLAGFCRRSEPR